MEIQKYEEIKIFKDNLSSFRETSRDTDGQEAGCMTNSEIQVINFDKVKESYISEMKLPNTPCSNDALYIGKDEKIFFVEFKNGVMKKEKIYPFAEKIYILFWYTTKGKIRVKVIKLDNRIVQRQL